MQTSPIEKVEALEGNLILNGYWTLDDKNRAPVLIKAFDSGSAWIKRQ
jgi:hypothetical protein